MRGKETCLRHEGRDESWSCAKPVNTEHQACASTASSQALLQAVSCLLPCVPTQAARAVQARWGWHGKAGGGVVWKVAGNSLSPSSRHHATLPLRRMDRSRNVFSSSFLFLTHAHSSLSRPSSPLSVTSKLGGGGSAVQCLFAMLPKSKKLFKNQ